MNKKNWLVRTYDENDNVLTVQLLKGLTTEEAYVESAAIVAGAFRGSSAEFGMREAEDIVNFLMAKHSLGGKAEKSITLPEDETRGTIFTVWISVAFPSDYKVVQEVIKEAEEYLITVVMQLFDEFR